MFSSSSAPPMAVINDSKLLRLTPAGKSDEEKLKFIEEMTANCKEVQQQVLTEILTQNGETEYLRRHGLGGDTDRAAFKSKIPVVTYEDLQPDILRIANGDASPVLSGHPITEFLTSSGTSGGERKLIPTIEQDADRRLLFSMLFKPIIKQYVQGLDEGKCLRFMFIKAETQTPCGLPARSATTSFYKTVYRRFCSPRSFDDHCSPVTAVLCPDTHQSMYIQMLCGLIHRLEVNEISTTFASGLVHAIHFLETNWSQLARDIATGTLSSFITDPSLRASVADLLHPDLDLSGLITEECSKPSWAGIISRIWPNTKFLQTVVTGTMAQYIPALEFYGGGLPIASMSYCSSECFSAINLTPICPPYEVSYTIMPNMGYFEFLAEGSEKLDPVDLADVEDGKEYELVVTTYGGLYRYRVGDVLKVSGFFNATPQLKFVRRKNVLLSIDTDKTDEVELYRAVTAAVELLSAAVDNVDLVDYTSHACTTTAPGHYVIYWELLWRGERLPEFGEVMERCCLAMEEELNSVYRQNRVAVGSIGPLEIRVVRAGTFEQMMELAISKGTTISQYKVARCMSFKPNLELLDSSMLSAHFSPSLPRWSPRRSY